MEKKRGIGGRPALIPIVLLGAIALAGCGGGVTTAGGGTGGTGISTGAVTGFGSVKIHEAEYRTDNAVKMVNGVDNSAGRDQDVFRIGMVVTVKFSVNDNNATEIDYEDSLKGPIATINPADNTFTVLGQPVAVDNGTLYDDGTGMPLSSLAGLADNNVVAVSGFADNAGRIRATLVGRKAQMPGHGDAYEIKGFIRDYSPADNTFRLSPLPTTGPGTTAVFGATGASLDGLTALDNGVFVEVKVDEANAGLATIPARSIEKKTHRTDLPAGIVATIEGLVTRVTSRTGSAVFFDLEGKPVQSGVATAFSGGDETNIRPNARLQAEGTISGGILSASKVIFR